MLLNSAGFSGVRRYKCANWGKNLRQRSSDRLSNWDNYLFLNFMQLSKSLTAMVTIPDFISDIA